MAVASEAEPPAESGVEPAVSAVPSVGPPSPASADSGPPELKPLPVLASVALASLPRFLPPAAAEASAAPLAAARLLGRHMDLNDGPEQAVPASQRRRSSDVLHDHEVEETEHPFAKEGKRVQG